MAKVSKTNCDKLTRILYTLKLYENKINKELVLFCEFASLFYYACTLYAFLLCIEEDVSGHEFNKKSFF